jgi:hypothetical protein
MPVGHFQRFGIFDIDLFLPRPPFAFGVFDRNARTMQAIADGAHDALLLGRLQDVIVLDVVARRLEIAIALGMRRLIAVVEEEKFEFGGHEGLHFVIGEPLQLLFQDRTW